MQEKVQKSLLPVLKLTPIYTSKGKELSSGFGFDDEEVENIFDLIAEEHPEL